MAACWRLVLRTSDSDAHNASARTAHGCALLIALVSEYSLAVEVADYDCAPAHAPLVGSTEPCSHLLCTGFGQRASARFLMPQHDDYSGECLVIAAETGDVYDTCWADVRLARTTAEYGLAVLTLSRWMGIQLAMAGELRLLVADGREFRGVVSTVIRDRITVRLHDSVEANLSHAS